MNVIALLFDQKGRKFIGTSELADAATRILLEMGSIQERGTVRDVVEERTVRFYQSEGLLETPTEKRGPASVYGYKHLLTLVVIKTMQSHHLPIKKIKEIIRGMGEGDLEMVLGDFSGPRLRSRRSGSEAREYLESLSESAGWEPPTKREAPPTLMIKSFSESPSLMSDLADSLNTRFSIRQSEQPGDSWKRHKLSPGIELHIREGADAHLDPKTRTSLLKKIERILKLFDDR